MLPLRPVLLSALLTFAVAGLEAGSDTSKEDRPHKPKRGLSWLLPIAFQSEPDVAMTFVTEMSEAGRKLAPPTAEAPAYYVIHASGSHTYGDSIYRTQPPSETDLWPTMRRSLAAAHYLEVENPPERAADLAIFYHWGVHAGINPIIAESAPHLLEQNLRERMSLVGGREFAARWQRARFDDAMLRESAASSIVGTGGINSAEYRMEMSDAVARRLLTQARDDVYFVVATAYDAAALTRNERIMLWRTKMTVSTQGVAMRETIAPMIAAAVPYLGRQMDEARPVTQRIYRDGRVEFGKLEVIGVEDTAGSQSDSASPASAGDAAPETESTPPRNN